MRDGVVSVGVEARCCGKSRETATTLSVLTGQVLGKCGLFFFSCACVRTPTGAEPTRKHGRTLSPRYHTSIYTFPLSTQVFASTVEPGLKYHITKKTTL